MNAVSPTLPARNFNLFLSVRQGIPLLLALICLQGAVFSHHGQGWFLLGFVAALTEVYPTFKRGRAYLQARSSIVRWDGMWAKIFRPLMRWLGKEEAWLLSFCDWNNHRVHGAFKTRKARRVLVILPCCSQVATCKFDIRHDLNECRQCGLCPIGDYLKATRLFKWETRIATHSRGAYREAREYEADLIVPISCGDRLLKGLTKLTEIPSYVIPLETTHGMCFDTRFSVPWLLAALEAMAEPRDQKESNILPLKPAGIA